MHVLLILSRYPNEICRDKNQSLARSLLYSSGFSTPHASFCVLISGRRYVKVCYRELAGHLYGIPHRSAVNRGNFLPILRASLNIDIMTDLRRDRCLHVVTCLSQSELTEHPV